LATFFTTGLATFDLTGDEAFGIAPSLDSLSLVVPKKLAMPVLLWLESRTRGPGGTFVAVLRAVAVDGYTALLASVVLLLFGSAIGADFVVGLMSEVEGDDWNPQSNPHALLLSLLLTAAFEDDTFAAWLVASLPTLRISAACVGVGSKALGFAGDEGFGKRVLPSASLGLVIPKKLPIPEPLWLESRGSCREGTSFARRGTAAVVVGARVMDLLSFPETTGATGFAMGLVSGSAIGTDLKPRSNPVAALLSEVVEEPPMLELEELVSALVISLRVVGVGAGCVWGILSDADCGVSIKDGTLEDDLNKLLKTVSDNLSVLTSDAFT
jgi:hypothetical protein